MLSKLAYRNAKRSVKDYVIYLITVIISFSLVTAFNIVIFSNDIMGLTKRMSNFKLSIIFVSLIVVVVIGWLINYTIKFMLEKRSKEFGTYMILGIEKKHIAFMFILENIFLGVFALVVSFLGGMGISQILTFMIMKIFNLPFKVNFSFSILPFLLTALYFVVIYIFVLFFSRLRLTKMKIYDLLYLERKNEKKIYKNKKTHKIIFFLSLAVGISAIFLFHYLIKSEIEGILPVFFGALLIILSIYGVTLSIVDFITSIVIKNKAIKYRGSNLIMIRQFASKVKTIGLTMGTLAMLILMTILSLNVSNMFNGMFQEKTEPMAPYDIMIYDIYSETDVSIGDDKSRLPKYMDFIEKEYLIEEMISYNVYSNGTDFIRSQLPNDDQSIGHKKNDCYLKLSDYNKLLQMRGMKSIILEEDSFYIHSARSLARQINNFLSGLKKIPIGNETLKYQGINDKHYATAWSRGSGYILIVPDDVIDNDFKIDNYLTSINTVEETTEGFQQRIEKEIPPKTILEESKDGYILSYTIHSIASKGAVLAENRSTITILSFSLTYLALIIIAVVGTILAIQVLSDSAKCKYNYQTLSKIGMEGRQINRMIQRQLLLFFGLPALYPILVSIIIMLTSINIFFNPFLASDTTSIVYIISNLILFLAIYAIYYFASYFEFKRNIKE